MSNRFDWSVLDLYDGCMAPRTAGPALSPARIRLALLALALGGFGIGSTEFVAMGLLPNMAADLLPHLYATNAAEANAQARISAKNPAIAGSRRPAGRVL